MTEYGKFNTDTDALKKRILAHDKYSKLDINQWIFQHMYIKEGMSVLDIGCGTGKQTIPIAQMIGDTGRVVAVDISQEALTVLMESAREHMLDKRISTIRHDIDELDRYFTDKKLYGNGFHRVLASYSVYYAKNPQRIFNMIHRILRPGGVFFFCGPSMENNYEIRKFHYSLNKEDVPPDMGAGTFIEKTGQKLARSLFSKVEVSTFQNPMQFDSAEALYNYWSSYNLYDSKLDAAFKAATTEYFNNHKIFETVKRVIGVKAIK